MPLRAYQRAGRAWPQAWPRIGEGKENRALADVISARKVMRLITPGNAYYQFPAGLADNKITDNTTLTKPGATLDMQACPLPRAPVGARDACPLMGNWFPPVID